MMYRGSSFSSIKRSIQDVPRISALLDGKKVTMFKESKPFWCQNGKRPVNPIVIRAGIESRLVNDAVQTGSVLA